MDLEKSYYGMIARDYENKGFGFIKSPSLSMQGYEKDLFFHFSRFNREKVSEAEWTNFIEARRNRVVKFKLLHSQKYPGKLAATNIQPIKDFQFAKVIDQGVINSDKKYQELSDKLDHIKFILPESEYKEIAQLAYDNSFPEYRLKLWMDGLSHIFNFEQFKKFAFMLNKYEFKRFKSYAKQHFEIKRNELRKIRPSKFTRVTKDLIFVYETSWKDVGFFNKKIMILDNQ